MIPRKTVEEVTDAANAHIVDIISGYVSLRRSGVSYAGCCPFHNEKTPSFYVTPAKSMFYCFGCHKGGSAISFIMEIEKISFPQALRMLGNRFGITVEDEIQDPAAMAAAKAAAQERSEMHATTEQAARIFEENLHNSPEGQKALAYLRETLQDSTIAAFRLGFGMSEPGMLRDKACAMQIKEEMLVKANIIFPDGQGGYTDMFVGRLTLPILDLTGKITGFASKLPADSALGSDAPMYYITPNNAIFSPDRTLYGIYEGRTEISRKDKCYLTDSMTDVWALHQNDLKNSVSTLGATIGLNQARLIKRFTKNITFIFDADLSGMYASLQIIDMMIADGLTVRTVPLPYGNNVGDYTRALNAEGKHTAESLNKYIEDNETDYVLFKTNYLASTTEAGTEERDAATKSVVYTIAIVQDIILREIYISECAKILEEKEENLTAMVSQAISQPRW